MSLFSGISKTNLHHAYLVEGEVSNSLPIVLDFITSLGVVTSGNPDFIHIALDTVKIEDARNLRLMSLNKNKDENKKILVLSTNNFLLEAQNTLLKVFEEPSPDTHFFVLMPDTSVLIPTLRSRMYHISASDENKSMDLIASKFLSMAPRSRIDWLKEFLIEEDENALQSARSKALEFLNSLEALLYKKFISAQDKNSFKFFKHIFKVRENLRISGSSPKTLLESVALVIPNF